MKAAPLLLSGLGLMLGVLIYQGAFRLPAPWSGLVISLLFVGLGALTFWWGRGDRFIQIAGVVIALFGVVRFFL